MPSVSKMKTVPDDREYRQPTKEEPVVVIQGDTRSVIRSLPNDTFQCAITSPPYWGVRDYSTNGQIGAEPDLNDYVRTLVEIESSPFLVETFHGS